MTKKFISLVLSLALVIGLIPMMNVSVSAAGGTTYFSDDFENYNPSDAWYDGASTVSVVDKSGTTKWTAANALKGEIVSMTGYDGVPTQAMKITLVARDGSFGGNERFNMKGYGTTSTTAIEVIESKIFVPADNGIASWVLGGIRKAGVNLELITGGNVTSNYFNVSDEWVKVTLVRNRSTGSTIAYVNDTVVSFDQFTGTGSLFPAKNYLAITAADSAGNYMIIDDVAMYHTPDVVTASSVLSSAEGVAANVNPTVNFTERVLSTTIHSDGEIYASKNVEFVKTSDGSDVAIDSVTLSADGKTLTIDPASQLEKGVQYTVRVSNLKDMYGRNIDPCEFTFTTVEPEEVVVSDAPTFTNENLFAGTNQEITKLENGYINASFTFENQGTEAQPAIILAVLKDEGAIKAFQFEQGTIESNGTLTFNGGFHVDDYMNQSIEVYVWDSLTSMNPLLGCKYVINKDAVAQQ